MFYKDVVGAVLDIAYLILIKLVCEKIQSGTEFDKFELPTESLIKIFNFELVSQNKSGSR